MMKLARKSAEGGDGNLRRWRGLRFVGRWICRYFFTVGLTVHLVMVGAVFYALDHYKVTLPQLVSKALHKYEIDAPWLVSLIAPAPAFPKHVTDGKVRRAHPRILPVLSAIATVQPLLERYREAGIRPPRPPCRTNDYLFAAICWAVTGNDDQAVQAIASIGEISILDAEDVHEGSSSDDYSNAWRVALAYDLIFDHPSFNDTAKRFVERKLEKALRRQLLTLDGDSLSLWHGRSTSAHIAFLTAIVLSQNTAERADLFRRAQAHFLSSIRALAMTEGWPEGYNYWINSRGFLAALAANAYAQGLDGATHTKLVKKALSRVAYWTIYATRPDNRVEGLGDEGSRVDLKDETRRVIDLIARLTRDPVLSSYSRYLAILHGASYYRGHRWSFFIANDPTVRPIRKVTEKSLGFLNDILPNADLFGPGALDQVFLRSGWGPDDTFISFRAGGTFTHHGHYDAGHFSLFKGSPLAVNSSVYNGDMFTPNRLYYSIRTIAKNSLLVLRPGERVRPNRHFKHNVAGGGQRLTMPTGSAILSVADWYKKLKKNQTVAGGKITSFRHVPSLFTYIASDLTNAYNSPRTDTGGQGGKVRRVLRKILYLKDQDTLLVHDVVDAVDPGYTKKWLLHTVQKPDLPNSRVLKGTASDGIMTSKSNRVMVRNGRANLLVSRLLPKDAEIRLIGGANYQYYVEIDGDDRDLNGTNFLAGAVNKPWFDVGRWRIEIQPGAPRKQDRFLIALAPSIDRVRKDDLRLLEISDDSIDGVATNSFVVLFVDRRKSDIVTFRSIKRQSGIIVTGLVNGKTVQAKTSSAQHVKTIVYKGVALLPVEIGPGEMVTVSIY